MSVTEFRQALAKHSLFAALSESELESFSSAMEVQAFKLGEVVMRMGDEGDGFYIIQSGRVRVVDDSGEGKPIALAVLKAGDAFGERSVLFGETVSASIRAAASTVVFKIAADAFKAVLDGRPDIREHFEAVAVKQREFNFLKTQNLLSGLKPKEVMSLVGSIQTIDLEDGQVLFHEGDPGDAMFLVREGALKVVRESAGDALLGIRKEGSVLGEMSLVYGEPRSAAAIAKGPAKVLRLLREDFEKVVGDDERIRELLSDQASQRLKQTETIVAGAEEKAQQTSEQALPGSRITLERIKTGRLPWNRGLPVARTDTPVLSGLSCLAMIAETFKQPFDWQRLEERQLEADTPDDMHSLSRKAEGAGYLSRLLKLTPGDLAAVTYPAVVSNHAGDMAVAYRITAKEALLVDPVQGVMRIPLAEFLKDWDGQVLTISSVPDFGAIGKKVTALHKQFLPLMRPHLPLIARIVAITVVLNALGLLAPFFTKVLIDDVLAVGDWNLLYLMLAAILMGTIVSMIAGAFREFLSMHLMRRLTGTLFIRFFAHVMALPISVLNKWDTGSVMARFEENEKILGMASSGGMTIFMNTISIVIYTPILFVMEPRLAALVLVVSLLMGAIAIITAPKVRRFENEAFEAGAARDSHVIEVVKGIETIKALAKEKEFSRKGRAFFAKEQSIAYRSERFDNKLELGIEFLDQAADILILGIGAWMVLEGSMSAGLLIAFSGVASQVTDPVEELADFYDEILELRIALDRLNDILGSPREPVQSDVVCPPLKGHIRFEGVNFRYSDDGPAILSDISLDIQPGQKVAFVGRSGSGKTTLLRMVNRLLEPTEGGIFIDGIDVKRVDLSSLRQQIGVVEQSTFVFSGTIRENIAKAAPSLPLDAVVSAATLSGCHDFISQYPMRYDTRIGEGGRSLSGGQTQRMVIARAIANNPNILILDEATAALDNESERIIQRNLDRIMEGRTTLVIAHRLSTVRNSDLIVVLDEGRIAEKGTHDELMEKRGMYHYLATRSSA